MKEKELQKAYTDHCEALGRTKFTTFGWEDFQAGYKLALATQPEVPEQYEYWCIAFGRWKPIQELVEFLTSRGFKVRAVRGAEHE